MSFLLYVKPCITNAFVKIPKSKQENYVQELVVDIPHFEPNPDIYSSNATNKESDPQVSSCLYNCPEPLCLQKFQKYGNLNRHLDVGNTSIKKRS